MSVSPQHRLRRAGLLLASMIVASLAVIPASPANAVANGEDVPNGQFTFSVKLIMTGIPTANGGRPSPGKAVVRLRAH